jgi:aspartate kinase
MAIIVQKYGGSSVADAAKIGVVADRIAARRAQGDNLVVVVSAMGDTTDELLSLARQVTDSPARRELDMLLTAGERISMALLSMALNARGVAAISFTGSQSGIITNDSHTNARIVEVRPYRIQDELANGRVVIVAGYQGVSYRREITTLGRGGSDTTAVALAAALGAAACEIYSDVDGVFTADPRVAPQAQRLAEISYEEMQTLAESGARVLNAQAVEFARKAGIVIHARATAGGEGTYVRDLEPVSRVAGIAGQKDLVLVRLARPERLEEALEFLDASGAPVQEVMALTERTDLTDRSSGSLPGSAALLLSLENLHDFPGVRADLERRFGEAVTCREGLGAVAIVGVGIGGDGTHLRRALAALDGLDGGADRSAPGSAATRIEAVHAASLRILLLVPAEHVDACVRRLHEEFIGGSI